MGKRLKEVFCEKCPVADKTHLIKLDNADLSYLNDQKKVLNFRKSQKVIEEGNKPAGVFCLREGKLKVYKQGQDHKDHITRFLLPGDFLGLRAIISGNPYSHSAAAIEDSTACFIPKSDFFQLMIKYPDFARHLIEYLSKLLEEAEKKMTNLAQLPVKSRLAETLLFLHQTFHGPASDPSVDYLNLTRSDLANIIGTAQETVIRVLAEFRDDKMIALKGRKIYILNVEKLQKIALNNDD
ncbi:MAG: Crp/Fnr family transcriptional regulator [Bacteroidetes bacterium]|nr:Crp/Fnr family transcriptional regulator [Bacteroidota bacterium]